MHTRSLFPQLCLSLSTTSVTPLGQRPSFYFQLLCLYNCFDLLFSPNLTFVKCLPANLEWLPPLPNCSLRPLLTSLVSVCAKALPEEIGRELSEGNPPALQSL